MIKSTASLCRKFHKQEYVNLIIQSSLPYFHCRISLEKQNPTFLEGTQVHGARMYLSPIRCSSFSQTAPSLVYPCLYVPGSAGGTGEVNKTNQRASPHSAHVASGGTGNRPMGCCAQCARLRIPVWFSIYVPHARCCAARH